MDKLNLVINIFQGFPDLVDALKNEENVSNVYQFNHEDEESLLNIKKMRALDETFMNYAYNPIHDDTKLYQFLFEKKFYSFCCMMHRRNLHHHINIYDLANNFRLYFLYFMRFLNENSINFAFFSPGFSDGFDMLIYEICKGLQIKTLLAENYNYNAFYITTETEDWGNFKNTPEIFEKKEVHIYEVNPKPPHYITDQPNYNKNRLQIENKKKLSLHHFLLRPGKLFSKNFAVYLSRKFIFIHYDFVLRKRFISRELKKKREVPTQKFILFALHYQPESSTLAFSFEYEDQLLAIERCSKIIPEDWKVLVKENPSQISMTMRNDNFYDRLNNIPKVEFIHSTEEILPLIKGSQFVCTLTGSVSFEAIRLGVPSLVFGKSLYVHLPGVIHIDEINSYEDVTRQSWSLDEIRNSMESITKKMGSGFINGGYIYATDIFNNFEKQDFSRTENVKTVINSMRTIFSNIHNFRF